jgi:hypothetical protein
LDDLPKEVKVNKFEFVIHHHLFKKLIVFNKEIFEGPETTSAVNQIAIGISLSKIVALGFSATYSLFSNLPGLCRCRFFRYYRTRAILPCNHRWYWFLLLVPTPFDDL